MVFFPLEREFDKRGDISDSKMMFNGHCYNNHNNYDNTTKTKYSKSHENILETRMKVNVLLDQPEQSTVPSCSKISYTDVAYRNNNKDAT